MVLIYVIIGNAEGVEAEKSLMTSGTRLGAGEGNDVEVVGIDLCSLLGLIGQFSCVGGGSSSCFSILY